MVVLAPVQPRGSVQRYEDRLALIADDVGRFVILSSASLTSRIIGWTFRQVSHHAPGKRSSKSMV
jgi:hypothetical protein